MIKVQFPNSETECKALGYMAGRFGFKSFADGSALVPEEALAQLASEGITFTVEGRATYEQYTSAIRDASSPSVQ